MIIMTIVGEQIGLAAGIVVVVLTICSIFCCCPCIYACFKKIPDNNSNDSDDIKSLFKYEKYKPLNKKDHKLWMILINGKKNKSIDDITVNKKPATSGTTSEPLINANDAIIEMGNPRAILYTIDTEEEPETLDKIGDFARFVITYCKAGSDSVLLRINSPGGEAGKFMIAYDAIKRLQSNGFTVIALVDQVAASGGYLLACACNKIIASPSSTIGSVGVFIETYNAANLLKIIGINAYLEATGTYKGVGSRFADKRSTDDAIIKEEINYTFDRFKKIVKETRKNLAETVEAELFQAKSWYADDAPTGLIDEKATPDDVLQNYYKTHNIYIVKLNSTDKNKKKVWYNRLTDLFAYHRKFRNLFSFTPYRRRIMAL